MGFIKAGYVATVNDSVKKVLGREPRTFKAYTQDFKGAWA
jgi:hypothetical protein